MKNNQGKNTLLLSILMSSFGPVILGIGLIIGKSSTQYADFIRRTIELISIILTYLIYRRINGKIKITKLEKEQLENRCNNFVGFSMILVSFIMIFILFFVSIEDKGNVIPGLLIAFLGVVANSIFWIRYKALSKKENSTILKTQSNLYRAKTFVDISVTIALTMILLFPNSNISYYFDIIGTVCVSIYLFITGIRTIRLKIK